MKLRLLVSTMYWKNWAVSDAELGDDTGFKLT